MSQQFAKMLRSFEFNFFRLLIKSFLQIPNTPLDCLDNKDIYQIFFQCGFIYIGQIKQAPIFRLKEHKGYVKKQELKRSSIAQQCCSTYCKT